MTDQGSRNPDFRSGYVALVGAPNAGKSTLMNRLLQSRLAIVSPKPQTTRRRILGIVNGEGHQMILLDTPGILDPAYPLQKAMMKTVSSVLADADLVCLLIDAQTSSRGRLTIPEELTSFTGTRIATLNKIDLLRPKEAMIPMLQQISDTNLFDDVVPISALTGEGVDRLIPILVNHLPLAPPFYPVDQLTEQPERFFVAELIRERVFYQFEQEVPYSVEVEVTEFKERRDSKDYIQATLFVEQASQKGILIGRGGQAIRKLGEDARQSIEEFLGRPVYLELRVKVAPKWRRNEAALRRLGYRP
jgi:GTP-binding protein Era